MSKPTEEIIEAFIGLLKHLKVPMEETAAITYCLAEDNNMMMEAYYKLKEGNFNQTPKEAMTICCQVIEKHQET